MIIYILIIILLLFYIKTYLKYINFENFVMESFNNQCVKLNEKCVVYNLGSEDESNNCCSGYCVRKNNNFQYKVCSDKPENICGNFNKKVESIANIRFTTPSSIKLNSLNDKKNRFCNAAFVDWNLFKNDNKNITTTPSKDTDLYSPYEKISTNKCGILNIRPSKDEEKSNKSGSKCNGFFSDLFY